MELNQVARNIKAMHEKLPYEEMAVLYRNNNQAVLLSAALSRKGIPFHSDDKLSSPYKHWIFADMMAYYRLASGTGDWKDLIQVINHPNRFIPENALSRWCVQWEDIIYTLPIMPSTGIWTYRN